MEPVKGRAPRGDTPWGEIQEMLGCPGCRFAKNKCLGKSTACSYPGRIAIDYTPGRTAGRCLTRRSLKRGYKKPQMRKTIIPGNATCVFCSENHCDGDWTDNCGRRKYLVERLALIRREAGHV